LSEQQIVDCGQAFNNHGCDGGLPSQAFEYIRYNKGIELEKEYPYMGRDEKCRFNSSKVVATVSDVHNFTQGDEDSIYVAVGTVGPVSICFDVTTEFQFYKHGVFSSLLCHKDSQHVNHAVLAVGYNVTESNEPYWTVKNSWGADWGINGYVTFSWICIFTCFCLFMIVQVFLDREGQEHVWACRLCLLPHSLDCVYM
jgi:cathepsin H